MLASYFSNATERTHKIVVGEVKYPAEVIALATDADLREIALQRQLKCHDCRRLFSARELYHDSDVPGECRECADNFFQPCGCHPDDYCQCGA